MRAENWRQKQSALAWGRQSTHPKALWIALPSPMGLALSTIQIIERVKNTRANQNCVFAGFF
jgi:TRAP-type C4-dicarboxylate transport system permease small subunit